MKAIHLKTVFAAVAALLVAISSATAADYVWRNVRLGGGGYMPNLLFHPAEKGLAYLRSDMGGAYRWDNAAKTWLPLQDGEVDWNARGIESIALDPHDPDTVYLAAGVTHKQPATIQISHDRGNHWQRVPVSFRMGGNELGRDMGERLAIDPNNPSILYFASRYDGLQKSTDGGQSWTKVASFPLAGLGAPPDWRGYAGLSFVVFDPTSATDGKSQTIYVGNGDPGPHHLYRSMDGGASWAPVPGEPDSALLPIQAALSADGALYLTYANGAGPFMVSKGAVFKFDTKTGAWTDISPDAGLPAFAGLSLGTQDPGTVAVASLYRPGGDTIWISHDGGQHWTSLREISRNDVHETPFLKFGHDKPDFGWWMTGLAIDPFDPTHIAFTTGATVYATQDLGKPAMTWTPWTTGVEQTAVLALSSPTAGPPLVSGIGDIGGYTHFDLAVSPPQQENPTFTNSDTIDYAGMAPNVMVRSGTHQAHPLPGQKTASLGWSEDGGKSWRPLFAPLPEGYKLPDPIGYNFGDAYIDAPIAVSADGKTFIVSTPDAPSITRSRGANWAKVKGLPTGTTIVADRVDDHVFFAVDYAKHQFYLSIDSGFRFKPIKTTGLPEDIAGDAPANRRDIDSPTREIQLPFKATPGIRGDLWFVSQQRLFHSRDNGKTFAEVKSDLKVSQLAFGKAPPGKRYPALFAIGSKDDLTAIWRSDDSGRNWVRVNDSEHEYFRAFRCIAGDPRVFGRVYVGTDGRGIVYGEPRK